MNDVMRAVSKYSTLERDWVHTAGNGVEVECVVRQYADQQGKSRWFCGYVKVLDGVNTEHVDFRVHGGITFNAHGWLGFDCNHVEDANRAWTLAEVVVETAQFAEQMGQAVPAIVYINSKLNNQ